ncbi:hypothetical protein BS50DRAFT_583603 [Corynespora cassiicola Philippines]|uniref:CMP/dCMP-type deaminase domain-containing protein n=1 Tax=Corynespora cassiicola Philippines TaxID=1448308 RepID=A0A2T2P2Y8_CORCC|nr:hypothetical protein BS50DRAFT_583603 [Corynespora cassiicola Philippines]
MKTDHYLNLCLEQAAKSPLRNHHGYVVVCGGKVLGRGYNDYRPGFNGGALKTGQLSQRRTNNNQIANSKKEVPQKTMNPGSGEQAFDEYIMSENMCSGMHSNAPLSMYSEMMAIHSALAASSALASTTISPQKTYSKLSGYIKGKERLRRDAIKAVCAGSFAESSTEPPSGKPRVQDWRFEQDTYRSL